MRNLLVLEKDNPLVKNNTLAQNRWFHPNKTRILKNALDGGARRNGRGPPPENDLLKRNVRPSRTESMFFSKKHFWEAVRLARRGRLRNRYFTKSAVSCARNAYFFEKQFDASDRDIRKKRPLPSKKRLFANPSTPAFRKYLCL